MSGGRTCGICRKAQLLWFSEYSALLSFLFMLRLTSNELI